jgi:GDP-L-fucose synthase
MNPTLANPTSTPLQETDTRYSCLMRMYIAGIHGMVGSAIARESSAQGHEVIGKSSEELDLTERLAVFDEIRKAAPAVLIIAAAKVGGIGANSTMPVDFLSLNLQIQTNLLDAAHAANVKQVLFLGSSCIYPKYALQPIVESELLKGELEPTNEAYAIAKIAGLKLVEAYRLQYGHRWISAMPTNLYGPNDNFDPATAHVLPALIHRFHSAKVAGSESIEVWGDGTPLREFLHVEDLARACLVLLHKFDESVSINIGSREEISIKELAKMISRVVGYSGEIVFNSKMPNGTPRKLLDSSRVNKLGWEPQVRLEEGLASTYSWFLSHREQGAAS